MFNLSSSIFNIWNTVITTVLCPYLIILTSISSLDWFWLIFIFIMGHIFLLLCMNGNFLFEARHCEFCLIECWIFLYFYKKILNLCSGTQFHYLETVWSFQFLLWRFVQRDQSSIQHRNNYSYYWSKSLLSALPNALWITRILSLVHGNRHCSRPCVSSVLSSLMLWVFFP